jgi:hypothetical protein
VAETKQRRNNNKRAAFADAVRAGRTNYSKLKRFYNMLCTIDKIAIILSVNSS